MQVISHVALACKDPIATEKFYVKHFGFRRARVISLPNGEQIVFLRMDDCGFYLELFKAKEDSPLPRFTEDGPWFPSIRHLAFKVDDVERKLQEMGDDAEITHGPGKFDPWIWGWKTVWVADPDGNIVEISQGYFDQYDPTALTPASILQNRNFKTCGTAIPALGQSELSDTAQLIGTVNNNRGRWNPFLPENNMDRNGGTFTKGLELRANGGRHGDGVYAFRIVRNHNLNQVFKADHETTDELGKPILVSGEESHQAQNIMIRVREDGLYRFSFAPSAKTFDISPAPEYLTTIRSIQLNGFVWDDENEFQKFDETRPNHEMTQTGDWWGKTVQLKTTGGIAGRKDGVYQFLFSVNNNEDWGFCGLNDRTRRLCGGTGFGSSGGQSRHSAITIKVVEDGDYTIRIHPTDYFFEVQNASGGKPVEYLNKRTSFQLLGTFSGFDPTQPECMMEKTENGEWSRIVDLEEGVHGANFAINQELFLDTMALGTWLDSSTSNRLVGQAWHGKPNEPNVFFRASQKGPVKFTYDANSDEFSIEALEGGGLEPIVTIDTFQLVGDPMGNWDPTNTENNMQRIGRSLFRKTVRLEGGKTYKYKYTANNWPWVWTFADYELDGYGSDYLGHNPAPKSSRLEDLRRLGHLTTHGNPEPLQVLPDETRDYTFIVDLETGAYAVHAIMD